MKITCVSYKANIRTGRLESPEESQNQRRNEMGNQPYLTEKETFKINDNIAIGINAINRYRFACGKWNKLFSMTRAGAIITAIQKKLKCDKLQASEIFKENAKRGDYT